MLKIKDDVDLKELSKFGLQQEYNYNTKAYDGDYYCNSFKVFKNRHIRPYNGTGFERYDIMYELIKADLVEKVKND